MQKVKFIVLWKFNRMDEMSNCQQNDEYMWLELDA